MGCRASSRVRIPPFPPGPKAPSDKSLGAFSFGAAAGQGQFTGRAWPGLENRAGSRGCPKPWHFFQRRLLPLFTRISRASALSDSHAPGDIGLRQRQRGAPCLPRIPGALRHWHQVLRLRQNLYRQRSAGLQTSFAQKGLSFQGLTLAFFSYRCRTVPWHWRLCGPMEAMERLTNPAVPARPSLPVPQQLANMTANPKMSNML